MGPEMTCEYAEELGMSSRQKRNVNFRYGMLVKVQMARWIKDRHRDREIDRET